MKLSKVIAVGTLVFLTGCTATQETKPVQVKPTYTEDWASLGKHNESPEWFKDSKLGIYFHWGVYSVPAFDSEWYPRNMHLVGSKVNKHHIETYGELSEFGYHDFVPQFKAEKFDAVKWAELFKKSGAKFAGLVAEHHDGFSMWDTKVSPWNVVDKGPHRDIMGELESAIKEKDMKFLATFHHAKHLQRGNAENRDHSGSHYPYLEGSATVTTDPELAKLYGNLPSQQWHKEYWFGKLKEVIDNYSPDIIWFDTWLDRIPEHYRQEFAAYYLNEAEKSGKEVVIVRKQHDLPLSMSVDDLEQSRKNYIGTKTWMTDATISTGSWSYTKGLGVKKAIDVLHMLIDITSKNGVLLLNISPKANGTIPDNQVEALLSMGDWLGRYGEAIYGTEAWYTFGEGPVKEPEGHYNNNKAFHKIKYSSRDVRYTTKDYNIYATIMGSVNPSQEFLLTSFAKKNIKDSVRIEEVTFLGNDEKVAWSMTKEGLKVKAPTNVVNEMATVIKVITSA